MTSHSTGPFDPIAEAPGPAERPEQAGPGSGGPFGGPPNMRRIAAETGPPGMPPPRPAVPPTGAFPGRPATPFTGPPGRSPVSAFTGPPSGPMPGPAGDPLHGGLSGPPSGPLPVAAEAHHEPGRPGGGYRGKTAAHDNRPARPSAQAAEDDQLWAMMAYLGLIFFAFVPPLAIYLLRRHESRYVRLHAAQALNLWITAFLYALSFMIISGILAFDTISTALAVGIPLIVMTGAAMLLFAVRAAVAAGRGVLYEIPGWICVPMVT